MLLWRDMLLMLRWRAIAAADITYAVPIAEWLLSLLSRQLPALQAFALLIAAVDDMPASMHNTFSMLLIRHAADFRHYATIFRYATAYY